MELIIGISKSLLHTLNLFAMPSLLIDAQERLSVDCSMLLVNPKEEKESQMQPVHLVLSCFGFAPEGVCKEQFSCVLV